jgi:hypothetical protein
MSEEDLRDCFAMFAMNGLISRGHDELLMGDALCKSAYDYADAMLEARKPKDETGIIAVKRSSTTRRSK